MHVNRVVLAQRNSFACGFEFGRSGWGAERFRSLMLFVLVFAIFELPEDIHILVIRERRRLRKRK